MRTHRLLALGLLAALPAIALANPIWKGDFETGDLSQWEKAQEVSADRLQVVTSPVHQGKYALKATVVQGDNPIGASGNRNELVQGTFNPEGSEYYYRWSTMFAPDYPSEQTWQVFTQWHQSGCCGSPPVEFDVKGEEIMLTIHERAVWTAPLVRGTWNDFILHVKWSDDPNKGFVELYYNGKLVLPKMNVLTEAQTYMKQGLYRNSSISKTGVVYHDGMVQGETLEDVMPSENQNDQGGAQVADTSTPASSTGSSASASSATPATTPSSTAGNPSSTSASGSGSGNSGTSGSVIASPSGSNSLANTKTGGCSATGPAGLSLLALATLAVLFRRRPVRVPVRSQYRRR